MMQAACQSGLLDIIEAKTDGYTSAPTSLGLRPTRQNSPCGVCRRQKLPGAAAIEPNGKVP
jgi:hypothetical protein